MVGVAQWVVYHNYFGLASKNMKVEAGDKRDSIIRTSHGLAFLSAHGCVRVLRSVPRNMTGPFCMLADRISGAMHHAAQSMGFGGSNVQTTVTVT